jgi:hypothetical protein
MFKPGSLPVIKIELLEFVFTAKHVVRSSSPDFSCKTLNSFQHRKTPGVSLKELPGVKEWG